MKNVAITFLHGDQRVQITSLKSVIRLLLKREEGSEGGNISRGICLNICIPIYAHTYTDTYLNDRLLQEEVGCCSARVPSPRQMRKEPQFKTPSQLQKKEQDPQITPVKSYLDAISRFSQCKLTLLPGLIQFSCSPSPSHPGGIHHYFAFSFSEVTPGAPPGRRLAGPRRGRGPFRARREAGGAGVPPGAQGGGGFRVPASAPHTATPLTLGRRQEIVSEVGWRS